MRAAIPAIDKIVELAHHHLLPPWRGKAADPHGGISLLFLARGHL